MPQHAVKLATYEDLLALPHDERAEILAGQIQLVPSPLPRHSKVQGTMRRFVGGPYDDDDGHGGPGGWWIFVEVDVQLSLHDVVRPDLSGWRREHLPNPGHVRPITTEPDWVCEVISPSTSNRDRVAKRALYVARGVQHYWIVDPESRSLEALELQGERWLEIGVYDDQSSARIAPFDGVELEIGRLFLPKEADTEVNPSPTTE